jgi:hypothetical protein
LTKQAAACVLDVVESIVLLLSTLSLQEGGLLFLEGGDKWL